MQGKRRRQPAPPIAAGRVVESPDAAATALPVRSPGIHYDADLLFPDAPRLSERERETLELVADGKTNGVIATVMGNSKRTVEDFITKIMEKLKVADRNEAMALYHQAVVTKLVQEKAEVIAENRALRQQLAALRRQLRRSS
ncbi:MAG: helix-turn-helix transcriptional regulator [Verrucomicrobiota bacterium]|nr:helix-turn-helix transcriptional regulator [Verrucomicrobiota bacterium]